MSKGNEKNPEGPGPTLDELITETKNEPEATGVRIFAQYCLEQEQRPDGFYTVIVPRILCQSMSDKGQIFGQYEKEFQHYRPIETKTTPEKIQRIGAEVEKAALKMANYMHSAGLKAIVYSQTPPKVIEVNKTRTG